MIWLTWRQHRLALLAVTLLLATTAIPLFLTGLDMRAAFDRLDLAACIGRGDPQCVALLQQFSDQYRGLGTQLLPYLNVVPALFGVFMGAPLLAHELEQGTHCLVWTQGVTRLRWLGIKFGLLSGGTALAAVAFTAMLTWWRWPLDQLEGHFAPNVFDFEGLVPAAYALAALALGACVGLVVRRTIPAMAATLALFFLVRYPLVELQLRPRYLQPLTENIQFSADSNLVLTGTGDWVVDAGLVDPSGHRVDATIGQTLARQAIEAGTTPAAWFQQHGYMRWIEYQPADRFWTFQAIEAGIFLVFAAVLLLTTLRLVSRAAV